jgi:uncharacterized protein
MPFTLRPYRGFPVPLQFSTTLVLSLVCLTTPAWADFQAGIDAYNRGDYATALREIRPLAEKGDADAQSILGLLYDSGRGVPQDTVQARQWYEKAAAQGNAPAQYNLGVMYRDGEGVPQDYAKARQWFEKAAAQADTAAQTNLGLLYYAGEGVPQDYQQALRWFRLLADQGDAHGQVLLGSMYHEGKGVPQDYVQAHKWYNLGAANGEKLGVEARDILAKQMTPAQIAEAQHLAREWKPKSK